jgi:hypothetical protein
MRRILFPALLLASAVACTSNSTPTMPAAPLNVTGKWTGAISFQGISGNMTWQLTQTDSNVSGPVTIALPTGTVLLNGFLTGTLTGSSLDYTVSVAPGGIPTQPACAGQLKGTMTVTATTINGPVGLSSSNCTSLMATTTVALNKS